MTHYPTNVARETQNISINERPYTIAYYEKLVLGTDDKNKPKEEVVTLEIDSRTRGRGKMPTVHPQDSAATLVKIVTFRPDPEEAARVREEKRVARAASKAAPKKLTPEEKEARRLERAKAREENAAERAEQQKAKRKEYYAKKREENAFRDANGNVLDKRSVEYRILMGKNAPKARNHHILGAPEGTNHEEYMVTRSKKILEKIVSEGERVYTPSMTMSSPEDRFAFRRPAIFRGFNDKGAPMVEVVMHGKAEIVALHGSHPGIYVRKSDAPALPEEDETPKATTEQIEAEVTPTPAAEVEVTPTEEDVKEEIEAETILNAE